jgi:hypothetical protein
VNPHGSASTGHAVNVIAHTSTIQSMYPGKGTPSTSAQ